MENTKINDMTELNEEFRQFLHTKGIKAKYKLVCENMHNSYEAQKEADHIAFEQRKAKSIEENKDFYEFIHTKGIKAKFHLVINNIKKSAKENKTQNNHIDNNRYSAQELQNELDLFLKSKNLNSVYEVKIISVDEKNN